MKLFLQLFFFQFFCIAFFSCRSLDRITYSNASVDPIEMKLLSLKKTGFDGYKYEADEIENICESTGPVYGYINFSGNLIGRNKNGILSMLNIPFPIPLLMGVPMYISVTDVQLQCEIQNKRHERIAVFTSTGKAGVPCGFYYGYGLVNSQFKSIVDATKMANKGIRNQLTPEVVLEINKKLLETGTIE